MAAFCVLTGLALLQTQHTTTHAQVPPPITSSGLNTQIGPATTLPNGRINYDITGGSRPGNGMNLFHSFGEFSIPTNNIANFLNETSLPTSNILSRVTGENRSNIFGTLQTTGFGNANLFLMNPAGIIFGPTASLNVGGMVTFTTANYLRLVDQARFYADLGQQSTLSSAPVAAFGFLGPQAGPISLLPGTTVQALPGQGVSMVGGDIEVLGSQVSAPAGLIQMASVASPGEVVLGPPGLVPDPLDVSSFSSLGRIDLQSSAIDVSGSPTVPVGGAILIRSGQFVMENSLAQSITVALDGGPISIEGRQVEIKGGQIQTATLGPGNSGDILINADSLSLTDGVLIASLQIPSPLFPVSGQGGTIAITASESISVSGQRSGTFTFLPGVPGLPLFTDIPSGIYAQNFTASPGSNIFIETPRLTLEPGAFTSLSFGSGAAGDHLYRVGTLTLGDGGFLDSLTFGSGPTGRVEVQASESVDISGFLPGTVQLGPLPLNDITSGISTNTFGTGPADLITVSAPRIAMNNGHLVSETFGNGNAGGVDVQVGTLTVTGGGIIGSSAFTLSEAGLLGGAAGPVTITATDQISISGHSGRPFTVGDLIFTDAVSAINSATFGTGNSGIISIKTPVLTMADRAIIAAGTFGDGEGGSVFVEAGSASLRSGAVISSNSGVLLGDQLLIGEGSTIPTIIPVGGGGFALAGNGPAGAVDVTTSGTLSISEGSSIFTSTLGNGSGGNINLQAKLIEMINNGLISARSNGTGNAGDIGIIAGGTFLMENSSVTTQAAQAGGGKIEIKASDMVRLTNSQINTSVADGAGGGGDITIDPNFVILQNSQILAQALLGVGGNISITTNLFLPDSLSIVDASSQFGVNGNVTIQSPISQAGGKIVPLSNMPLETTALLGQRCAALAAGGQFSSFVMTGRDVLPTEPGEWLASPLAAVTAGASPSAQGEGDTLTSTLSQGEREQIVSVRRLSPPGAGMKVFSTDWMAGCGS